MTAREIQTLLRDYYTTRSRKGEPFAWGEIAPGVYWEMTKAPGMMGGEVFGVYIVALTPDGLTELAGKCRSCGSLYLARKHIRALKIAYGMVPLLKSENEKKAVKKTSEPRKRGKGLTKVKL